jgi:DNA-binding transcriptional ArsR family regulator
MPEETSISARVRALILDRVRSIEALELLMQLHAAPERSYAFDALSRQLKLPESDLARAAADLSGSGLTSLAEDGRSVAYSPESDADRELVNELEGAYRAARIELIILISQNAIGRVRNEALKTFSEAFRLKGPKKNG